MRTTEYTVASGEVKRYEHRNKTANCNLYYRGIFVAHHYVTLATAVGTMAADSTAVE